MNNSPPLTIDGYPVIGNAENEDHLYHTAQNTADKQRERAILDAAKPCPFCGSTKLTVGWWCVEDDDVESIECDDCYGGAPFASWQNRA